jgi:hypothetical protein
MTDTGHTRVCEVLQKCEDCRTWGNNRQCCEVLRKFAKGVESEVLTDSEHTIMCEILRFCD